jgi:hypothetical protein
LACIEKWYIFKRHFDTKLNFLLILFLSKIMKKIFTICSALFLGTTAFSQTVGLIGPSIPGNTWSADTTMNTTDNENFTLTLDLLADQIKFRQDDGWDIAWGDGGFPAGIGNVEPGSANINVPEAGNYTVTFVLSTGEYNFQLNVANISENSANMNLSVYPNPSNESVNFRFGASTEATITLFDLTGKEVSSKTETAQTINVNTENLNEGIYMYQVKVGNEITTGKISKK